MCRFALYLGSEIHVRSLITVPANSIIHQSFHSHNRSEPLNGDGFGVAWYPPDVEPPAVFKSATPAWNNRNLREIARVTRTRCLLAHVRAASPGLPVNDLNCHPFVNGQVTFMHNGHLGGFGALRRRLLAGLSDEAFASIEGSTDSEHMFAILLDHLRACSDDEDPTERLARAMLSTIESVETLRRDAAPDQPALLNLVACDGESAVITRYASGDAPTNSLYFTSGKLCMCSQGLCHMEHEGDEPSAVLVVSEPLDDSDSWTRVDPGHMVLVTPELKVSVRPIEVS